MSAAIATNLEPILAHAPTGAAMHIGAWTALIPILPLIAAIVCGVLALRSRQNPASRVPALICIASLVGAFLVAVAASFTVGHDTAFAHVADWIDFASFHAHFAFLIDPLTIIMLLVVTGIGSLVAIYASEYMAGDRGYARFFAFVSLFIVAMTLLVLADNLVLLYLGWEGVGLCSYLLIGFYYEKPAAVAAAKKAFIVNRIGDLGFALGIMLTYLHFDSVQIAPIIAACQAMIAGNAEVPMAVQVIPFLLMLGAFGKSAQLPLYVWLPDAMEGPTPVSALIHAATMVTAGIYMIARLFPLFHLSPCALPTVAWVGGLTALFSATIAMAQYDIKRIFAYSTVSQLGYMFLGLGLATTTGAVFHLFTHAFFKALLFLGCGAVMHGFAGQLDLRKLSGLWNVHGWRIVSVTMLIGCLALAGFPLTSGFFSKDMILAQAFIAHTPGHTLLGWLGLLTAGLTAYYTFRVFFRVFLGPENYSPADDAHGHHDHDHFHPHAPGPAINGVLIVLAIGALLAGFIGIGGDHHGWFGSMIHASTAAEITPPHEAPPGFFNDPHKWMMLASAVVGLVGIAIAWYLHLLDRNAATNLRRALGPVATAAERKWGVDEGYDMLIRKPLRAMGHVGYLLGDTLIINGLVALVGALPRMFGSAIRPIQNGRFQGYGLSMATGVCAILIWVWWIT